MWEIKDKGHALTCRETIATLWIMTPPNNKQGLFANLERYALNPEKTEAENLSTEVLAYLLRSQSTFRKRFLDRLLIEKKPLRRQFRGDVTIITQDRFGDCIFDLRIKSGEQSIIIENKLYAGEGFSHIGRGEYVPQVQKYLNKGQGHVAFLAPRDTPPQKPKKNKGNYLGHLPWEDVCGILRGIRKKSQIMEEFVQYLEEKNMAGFQPFEQRELKSAAAGYAFIAKAESLLQVVKDAVDPFIKNTFNVRSLKYHVGQWPNYVYLDNRSSTGTEFWFRPHQWKKSTLAIAIAIDTWSDERIPQFSIHLSAWKSRWKNAPLDGDGAIRRAITKMKKRGWEENHCKRFWCMTKRFPLSDKSNLVEKAVGSVKDNIKELYAKETQIVNLILRRSKYI